MMKIAHSLFAVSILSGILCLPSSSAAQNSPQPTLKGHTLGESATFFIAHSPALRATLATCMRKGGNDRTDSEEEALVGEMIAGSSCTQLLHIRFSDPQATFHIINPGLRALFSSVATDGESSTGVLDFVGSVAFTHGHLDLIEVQQTGSWEDLQRDIEQKFGRPTHRSTYDVQNGYGARFTLMKVEWDHANHVVIATEGMTNALVHYVDIEMMTPSYYKTYQDTQNQRKNSLD